MVTIYHNAACSKSLSACNLLQEQSIELNVVEYLITPPTKEVLIDLLTMLGRKPSQLIRRSEPLFMELYAGAELTEEDSLQAMLAHPVLIERPIVVKDGKAIIGRPPESVLDLLR